MNDPCNIKVGTAYMNALLLDFERAKREFTQLVNRIVGLFLLVGLTVSTEFEIMLGKMYN
jgi:hypothetical protein